jgi:hypothetical protein
VIASTRRVAVENQSNLVVVGFAKALHIGAGAALFGHMSARFQSLFIQTAVIPRRGEFADRFIEFFEEDQNRIAKAVGMEGELAIVVQSVAAKTETGSLDAVLVGRKKDGHKDSEEHECEHRQANAKSPKDPSFREPFQVFSDLCSTLSHRDGEASRAWN